jgi:hypothetical protein
MGYRRRFVKGFLDFLFPEEEQETWPYVKRERLLTPAEKDFFYALLRALEGKFQVFAKVRLDDGCNPYSLTILPELLKEGGCDKGAEGWGSGGEDQELSCGFCVV